MSERRRPLYRSRNCHRTLAAWWLPTQRSSAIKKSSCGSESMTLPIAQLHGYMVQQQCRYGLITTYDMTWFFKIVATLSSNNSYAMAISDGIPADYSISRTQTSSSLSSSSSSPEVSCTLLRCWLYFMHLAKVDTSLVPGFPPVQRILSIGRDDAPAQHDSPSSGEGAGDKDDQDFVDKKRKAPSSSKKGPSSSKKKQKQTGQQNSSYRGRAHRTSVVLKSLGQETFFDAQRSAMINGGAGQTKSTATACWGPTSPSQ